MAMRFHQKRFFAYPSGAPNLHSLSAVSSLSHVLVTTDRSVSLLGHGETGYSLRKLDVDALHSGGADVVAAAVVERPGRPSRVAVVYAVGESFFLQLVTPLHDAAELLETSSTARFELEAAPTNVFSVKATGSGGDMFYGVMACCADSMLGFGFVENEKAAVLEGSASTGGMDAASPFIRLDNVQFAAFFPEFATFARPILAVDRFMTPGKEQGWIAFGCADGLVRVFHGQVHGGCLGGPYKTKDLQQNGPVTSVALFPKMLTTKEEERASSWCCNLLVTCAIGQAVVYEDIFNTTNDADSSEVLMDSDSFDSIFAGIVADIDLDGEVELLLGTDSQVLLAYKEEQSDDSKTESVQESIVKETIEHEVGVPSSASGDASPMSPASSLNLWRDDESAPGVETASSDLSSSVASSLARRRKWQRLPRSLWDMETFGAIYSLLWRDVNHDGVPELLVASSTGVYVYEADPVSVTQKLELVLATLSTSASEQQLSY